MLTRAAAQTGDIHIFLFLFLSHLSTNADLNAPQPQDVFRVVPGGGLSLVCSAGPGRFCLVFKAGSYSVKGSHHHVPHAGGITGVGWLAGSPL